MSVANCSTMKLGRTAPSNWSNDDYKCFIDYYKAIDFAAFSRLQKKYQPKTAHNAFFLILYGTGEWTTRTCTGCLVKEKEVKPQWSHLFEYR